MKPYYSIRNGKKLTKERIRKILAVTETKTTSRTAKELFKTKPYYMIYEERYNDKHVDRASNKENI